MGDKGMPPQAMPGQYYAGGMPQGAGGMQMPNGKGNMLPGAPMQLPGQMLGQQNGRPMLQQFPGQRPPMMGYAAPQMMQNPAMMGKGAGMMPQMAGMQKGFPGVQQMPQRDMASQPLTAAMLAQAPPGMQKQMLGEKLYPAVSRLQPELAGKITGMMLEMDNSELLMMLESETQLRQKVEEAMRVLQQMPK